MNDPHPSSSRRDFLTGRAIRRELEATGDRLADAVVEVTEHRPVPQGYDTIRLETRAMACPWFVIMNPGPPRQVMTASDALNIVHELEQQLTVYRDDSELMEVNRQPAGDPCRVAENLFELLQTCQTLWRKTEGAFDPTAGPLIDLWRTCRQAARIPTKEEVARALTQVGMQRVEFDPASHTVTRQVEGLKFDLGGIGKGFAIDKVVEHLMHEEETDFLVHGGHSSLCARGEHGGLGGWPVGIKNPLFTERRYATLLLQDRALSTSGSNIQYFRYQGQKYGHILDPRTGWPVEGLLSVTVVAPTATEADALSTAFYVMGLDKALRYCEDHQEIGAILIPTPERGHQLAPVVRNIPDEWLFFESEASGD